MIIVKKHRWFYEPLGAEKYKVVCMSKYFKYNRSFVYTTKKYNFWNLKKAITHYIEKCEKLDATKSGVKKEDKRKKKYVKKKDVESCQA